MKYSNFIELSSTYESVVDLDADQRNPHLWKEYIVHDDMKRTIDAVCQTINWEDNDKRRSFWIHGTYGTGKTYAAIVLKHLLEDDIRGVEEFFRKPSLSPYKRRFLKLREKGEFLVAWKSGVTDIKSGTHLMMEMEVTIKETLKEKFGDKAYYGRNSLISAAKDAISNDIIHWEFVFNSPQYGLSDEYDNLDEFKNAVYDEHYPAINMVKRICDDQHLAMFANTVGKFEEWIKDVIKGNGLHDTGIVFIWDEFTGFLRDCGDDNVLQRLSELCKQADAPFFLCLIVHRDPTWVDQLGGETYERILHRYHELEFHITESAAYDLIGDSILIRPGMDSQWGDVKRDLLKSISKYGHEFDALDQTVNINERMSRLCPLHPMTISMLSTVAQNFGASQRTLFRFMKDRQEYSEGVGFIHYIENNGPDLWAWLTPDYLWDYFFMRSSDVRSFDQETRKVIQHFQNKQDHLSDEYAMHVFKAAMLLIAVMGGSSVSNLYSRQGNMVHRIEATTQTLYRCFRGQLDEETIDKYLESFESIGLLRLDKRMHSNARLELPYVGGGDPFEIRLEQTKKKYTRHNLFARGGIFSKALESNMWDSTRSTFGRMYIAACSLETRLINQRLDEVRSELAKCPWKLGLLVVNVSESSEYAKFQSEIKHIARSDDTGRLVVALLREPCSGDLIDYWCEAITNQELSAEDGKPASSSQYEAEALALLAQWSVSASDSQIFACYGDMQFPALYGKSDLIKRIENDVLFHVFHAAPERIVMSNTAFRTCTDKAVLAGLTREVTNQQHKNISNSLKQIHAWEIDSLEQLKNITGPNAVVIAELAKLIERELSEGARVSLDVLWATLQQVPFGYYDSLATGCFLGLAFRSFINGSFNWVDGSNNTHLPTPDNLASMINKMVSGKALNEYFSSGSDVWRKFRDYAKAIFHLSDRECVSEAESRKYMRARIQEIGVPFWAIKYLPSENFGGDEAKRVAVKLVDLFNDFIYQTSLDQDKVMGEILSLFNGRGWLRKIVEEIFNDKGVMLDAFKRFIYTEAPDIEVLVKELDYSDKDLFDALREYLQESISTWMEDEVSDKLGDLTSELMVIKILNEAMGTRKKSYAAHQKELNNVFSHMKIPGTVIETLPYSWIPTLQLVREISQNHWVDIVNESDTTDKLSQDAKLVWEHLTEPVLMLSTLLRVKEITVSEAELAEIYRSLPFWEYETSATVFYSKLDVQLESISYNRNVVLLKKLWVQKSGTTTVSEWCNQANVPIAWVVDGLLLTAIEVAKDVHDKVKVNSDVLQDAVNTLGNADLFLINDTKYQLDCFFEQVGKNYREAFLKERDLLIGRIKTNSRISSDVYSWANKQPEIRKVLDEYLQNTYLEQAKSRVRVMPEAELREAMIGLLDKNPQLYSHLLK